MGTRIKLSNGRRLVDDVIRMANHMPMAGLTSEFETGMVATLRRHTRPKISWNVLFMKAYASVCQNNADLRRSYVGFPWGHLYEHHQSVCMVTMAREYKGEERLLFARFNEPDQQSLMALQKQYDYYRKAPVEDIKQFRHQIRFAKAPSLVRRFAWWTLFNVWPQKRASHMGTFGMSFSGYKCAYGSKHLGPNTTILGVDPFPQDGLAKVLLTFDHRVIDGTPATKIFQQLYHMLNTAIKVELAELTCRNPETGEEWSKEESLDFKKRLRARRIEANRQRKAA